MKLTQLEKRLYYYVKRLKQTITDLETKLAESKEQLIAMNEKSNKIKKESYYLKQQLAEKDKVIENLEMAVLEKDKELDYYKSWFADDEYEQLKKSQNQTAIAELEKAKVEL